MRVVIRTTAVMTFFKSQSSYLLQGVLEDFYPGVYRTDVFLVCHAGVFPIIKDLTRELRTFSTRLISLFNNRAFIHRADLNPKILDVKRLSLYCVTPATTIEVFALFTIYSTR